jgi:hypothetical protein
VISDGVNAISDLGNRDGMNLRLYYGYQSLHVRLEISRDLMPEGYLWNKDPVRAYSILQNEGVFQSLSVYNEEVRY